MKKIKILIGALFLFSLLGSYAFGQQDYKIVQDFKTKVQQIKDGIKNAGSLSEVDKFEAEINQLETNNKIHKELLDKSLYPDDFNGSIESLRKELSVRKGDFTQISDLESTVADLNEQIGELNKRNIELMALVRDLSEQSKKDKKKIELLQKSIVELRASLRKRDNLVIGMIDSLMPADFRNGGTLSNKEKQNIYSKAEKRNVLENLQNAIEENIRFLQVTTLNPDDIDSIKEKKVQFEKTWRSFGPQIIEIYSSRGKKVKNAREIDAAFDKWNSVLDLEPWNSIGQEFSDYGIRLGNFSNGAQFTQAMLSYSQEGIKNVKSKGDSADATYKVFADSAWYGNIRPLWINYLTDNNLLTEAQKDTIDAGILRWKNAVYPADYSWLYIAGAVLLSLLIFELIRRNYRKKNGIRESSEDNPA